MKRISALALALLMLLASCGGAENETTADTAAGEETITETGPLTEMEKRALIKDDLPDKDYGGMQFRISTKRGTMYEIDAEELTGDVLNDAIYTRNTNVEERFNVELVLQGMAHEDQAQGLKNCVISGNDEFDLFLGGAVASGDLAVQAFQRSLNFGSGSSLVAGIAQLPHNDMLNHSKNLL